MSKRIALIGLDGSGKSANIDKMKTDRDYTDYRFAWVRWKPFLLKPAYLLMKRKVSKKNKDINNAENHEMRSGMNADYNVKAEMKSRLFENPFIREVWMFFALIDYFFQFHIKMLPLVFSGKNIIFDRSFLDLFVDQGINFGYTPEKIKKEINKHKYLFSRIDSYVYIRVSPETCYQRKHDIPNMDYLNKRFKVYEYLSKDNSWVIVDGELPFEEVNIRIKKKILG